MSTALRCAGLGGTGLPPTLALVTEPDHRTERPLAGRTIVVTRATAQSSSLVEALRAHGAEVVPVPVIAVADPADGGEALSAAVADLDRYDWVVVTSANGAERAVAAAAAAGTDLSTVRLAAIGPGSRDALAAHGLDVDVVPDRFVAEGLLDAFAGQVDGGRRVLLAQAEGARPVLREGLAAAGWDVDAVVAYRTVHPPLAPDLVARAAAADAVTFTSASTVRGFVAAAGLDAIPPVVATIGPITSAEAARLGVTVTVEAPVHTVAGVVDALMGHLHHSGQQR